MRHIGATVDRHRLSEGIGAILVFLVGIGLVISACSDGGGGEDITNPSDVYTVIVSPSSDSLTVGGSLMLSGEVRDGQGNTVNDAILNWSSVDPAIAEVSSAGEARGLGLGVARVVGRYETAADTAEITVFVHPVGSWEEVSNPSTGNLHAIWGSSPDNIWVGGVGGTMLHYDGAAWESVTVPTTVTILDMWGFSSSDIWAVTGDATFGTSTGTPGPMLHYDGTTWTAVAHPVSKPVFRIWGSRADDIWAQAWEKNSGSSWLHYDGSEWTEVIGPSNAAGALFGFATNDIWAGTEQGVVLHYDGTDWVEVDTPHENAPGNAVDRMWGSGADDLWAVGDGNNPAGTVIHYDGESWGAVSIPPLISTQNRLLSVWGTGPDEVWAGSQHGELRYFDGSEWSAIPSPTTEGLLNIWGTETSDLWAVGGNGTILRGLRGPS
jgi:hypothetical protein